MKPNPVFDPNLTSGKWAHAISWLLAPKRLISGFSPKILPTTVRDRQPGVKCWIEFHPANWLPNFDDAARTAIVGLDVTYSEGGILVVGSLLFPTKQKSRVVPKFADRENSSPWQDGFREATSQFKNANVFFLSKRDGWEVKKALQISSETVNTAAMQIHEFLEGRNDAGTHVLIGAQFELSELVYLEKPDLIAALGREVEVANRLTHLLSATQQGDEN
jgi:hypothetical protein